MSQDQKPGRVRMLAGPGGGTNAAPAQATEGTAVAEAAAGGAAGKSGKRAGLLPILLFMAGCIGGGVAVARLGPL